MINTVKCKLCGQFPICGGDYWHCTRCKTTGPRLDTDGIGWNMIHDCSVTEFQTRKTREIEKLYPTLGGYFVARATDGTWWQQAPSNVSLELIWKQLPSLPQPTDISNTAEPSK